MGIFFYIITAMVVILFLVVLKRVKKDASFRWGLWTALCSIPVVSAIAIYSILRQKSSTAAIGIIFLPFVLIYTSAFFWGVGWSIYNIINSWELFKDGLKGQLQWLVSFAMLVGSVYFGQSSVARIVLFYQYENENLTSFELSHAFDKALEEQDYFLLSAIVGNPKINPDKLMELINNSDPNLHKKREEWINMFDRDSMAPIRHALRNPSLPPEALKLLVNSKDNYVLGDVAVHRHSPEEVIRKLHETQKSYLVKWGLAQNPNTPTEILHQLTDTSDENTLTMLAANRNLSPDDLDKLSSHGSNFVRRNVARNPSLRNETFAKLLNDSSEEVRFYLAINKSIPKVILQKLSHDSSSRISKYAQNELDRLQAIEENKNSAH